MKVLECIQVDQWDGGDRHNFDFYVTTLVAESEIKQRYPHCSMVRKTFVVFDSLKEVEENRAHVLCKQVWAKLTLLERKAIGMQDPN